MYVLDGSVHYLQTVLMSIAGLDEEMQQTGQMVPMGLTPLMATMTVTKITLQGRLGT